MGSPAEQRAPSSVFEMFLLLLVAEQPAHGSHLVKQVKEVGFDFSNRTVYGTLQRLQAKGLLRSDWEIQESGPPWRVYRLTQAGEEALCSWGDTMHRMSGLLRGYRVSRRSRRYAPDAPVTPARVRTGSRTTKPRSRPS